MRKLLEKDVLIDTGHYQYNKGNPTSVYAILYQDGTLGLQVDDEDEGLIEPATVSVNLSGTFEYPSPYCIFVRNYSLTHEGVADALMRAGLGEKVRTVQIGYSHGFEFKLAPQYHSIIDELYDYFIHREIS